METRAEEVLRRVWTAKVPIRFQLAVSDISTARAPCPLYLLVGRISYFPLTFETLRHHFYSSAPATEGEIWLEAEGAPLPWQYPVGVLFDIFNTNNVLPWTINVHFQSFPADQLLRCGGGSHVDTVRSSFTNDFKQACFLMFQSSGPAMGIPMALQQDFWSSLQSNDVSKFVPIRELIFDSLKASIVRHPVRIVLVQPSTPLQFSVVQRPLALRKPDGIHDDDDDGGGGGGGGSGSRWLLGSYISEVVPGVDLGAQNVSMRIHGVAPALDNDMSEMCTNLCSADLFLYIVIHCADQT